MTASDTITRRLADHLAVVQRMPEVIPAIEAAAALVQTTFSTGGKVLLCGNGGSCADAQHIAGELVGRFLFDRPPLAAVALTPDSVIMTAVGNDYGFDTVFERQVLALGRPGDLLWAMSTSGNSPNVLRAIAAAKTLGMKVLGFTAEGGGKMATECDVCFRVPSKETPRVQELHIFAAHVICEIIEASRFGQTG